MDDDTQVTDTFLWLKSPSWRSFPPDPRKVGENTVLVFGAHSTKILRIAHVLQEDSFLVESMIADARHIPESHRTSQEKLLVILECSARSQRGHPTNFLYNKNLATRIWPKSSHICVCEAYPLVNDQFDPENHQVLLETLIFQAR